MLDAGCWILDTGYWILDTARLDERRSDADPGIAYKNIKKEQIALLFY